MTNYSYDIGGVDEFFIYIDDKGIAFNLAKRLAVEYYQRKVKEWEDMTEEEFNMQC